MIKCIVIDDEPLAVRLLENHISKIAELKLVATAANALEAYRILQTQEVDLLFLDIQMPDLNGIEFLRSLNKKPSVIFTTAYREFAIEGFELEAVDYLLKPITFERFFKSVDRVLRNVKKENEDDFLILKSEGFSRKLLLKDILYFESIGNDIKAVLQNELFMVSKMSVSELAVHLQPKGFLRIHRSFIINQHQVTAISNQEVLIDKIAIPVGRSFRKTFDDFARLFSAKRLF
ncbi:two component transcriptional regulator, LytTR family [Pedobacter suwonensis]|uniref:Two component transcriptional regulator, LytTR family n=1 Tax=Pedobacter suwonensis TaxID=332999 RepID=A0A1I0SN42_9SPHI|nr:LytTR family DNA-binding domain-containing protein [Pedobacter suwonensis]SFA40918.1 two component transcriptional regulator, LytTR family [Pedobacter suwonensis]